MLSNPQKALLKTAQRQATLVDVEYRDAIATVSGMADCRSSTDDRLTDSHMDRLMSYLEAIYWRKVDNQELQHVFKANAAFRQRGFWAERNRRGNTSRDRFTELAINGEIADLEAGLAELGFGAAYCAAIRASVGAAGLFKYAAALKRTLEAKQRAENCPF